MEHNGKLELTWTDKSKVRILEPRILIEIKDKSMGTSDDNMLIHGDNLLALKALEQDFAGTVKCIYIEIIIPSLIQGMGKIKKCALAV